MPKAIRIRTSEGWQDVALTGPQGIQGPNGPQGIQGIQGVPNTLVGFYTTGPKAGNGGSIGGAWVNGAGDSRNLSLTTPAFATRALVWFSSRWDCASAAWCWFGGGCEIFPAPVADYGPKMVNTLYGRNIHGGHNSGVTWIQPQGMFWCDLAASTAYEFRHAAVAGTGVWVWDSSMQLCNITVALWPR